VSPVAIEAAGETAVLRFQRPVLTSEALVAATQALRDLEASFSALLVVSHHPRIFLAGAHLGEIARLDARSSGPYAELGRRLIRTLLALPIPVVAAVHGACAGGGLDLALACDWITAAPEARLGHPGIRRGLVTGWGGTALLPRRLGNRVSLALLAEARMICAGDAARIGLVDEIASDVRATALRRARTLARVNPRRLALWRTARTGGFVDIFGVNVVHTR
jgi:enoyl-CoA hydratase/carnithine racemase